MSDYTEDFTPIRYKIAGKFNRLTEALSYKGDF